MSVQQFSAVEFRQKLAGLVDPARILPDMELTVIKDEAIKLCLILAEVFSDSLDRKTLWERIGNGLAVCSVKCGGDWELLLQGLLDYVKADPGKVAANKKIENFIKFTSLRPKEWKDQLIRVCETKRMFLVVQAREEWNLGKLKEAAIGQSKDL
jgi:hypothetical protein